MIEIQLSVALEMMLEEYGPETFTLEYITSNRC